MKNNYKHLRLICFAILVSFISHGQNIEISLVNPENTSDGSFDYYEADLMIKTIDGLADFKLGDGQVYLNYNTAAFGTDIATNGSLEVTADFSEGYILGERYLNTPSLDLYDISSLANNTTSRASWAFLQVWSSGAISEVVTSTPKMMAHIKIKYTDVSQNPMVEFEDDENIVASARDNFFSACGPYDSPSTSLDCDDDPDPENEKIQFPDANFDSSQGTLSLDSSKALVKFEVFPNPTDDLVNVDINKSTDYSVYDVVGKEILRGSFNQGSNTLELGEYEAGIYFLRIIDNTTIITERIVLK